MVFEATFEASISVSYKKLLQELKMKNIWNQFVYAISKIDRQKVQIVLFIALLVLMIVAAGAPDDGGTLIR